MISAEGLGVAVIVGIGCEHLAALGGTLESIALAKAGIIKENRPVHFLLSWSTFGWITSTWCRILPFFHAGDMFNVKSQMICNVQSLLTYWCLAGDCRPTEGLTGL